MTVTLKDLDRRAGWRRPPGRPRLPREPRQCRECPFSSHERCYLFRRRK